MEKEVSEAVVDAAAKTVDDLEEPFPDLSKTLLDDEPSPQPQPDEKPDKVDKKEGEDAKDSEDVKDAQEDEDAEDAESEEELDSTEEEAKEDAKAEDARAEDVEQEKPKEGTPDKALQKVQQDLAAALRKQDELESRLDAGQKVAPEEKAAVKRKLDTVRAALAAKTDNTDLIDGETLAATLESLVETDDEIVTLRKDHAEMKAKLERLEADASISKAESNWQANQRKYPGVSVKDVWEKAKEDAIRLTTITVEEADADPKLAQKLKNAATNLFHERSAAALKSIAAKSKAQTEKPATTIRKGPPVTPGETRVTQSKGVPDAGSLNVEAREMQLLRGLVTDN